MDKKIALGTVGDLDFSFAGGKAAVTLSADTKVILEAIRKEIDGKLPAEAPAVDIVIGWIEAALAATV